jgi:hypothetical protein
VAGEDLAAAPQARQAFFHRAAIAARGAPPESAVARLILVRLELGNAPAQFSELAGYLRHVASYPSFLVGTPTLQRSSLAKVPDILMEGRRRLWATPLTLRPH